LKEVRKFSWQTANQKFEKEIVKQFYQATGIRLYFKHLQIDPTKYLKPKKGPKDKF